MLEMLVFSADYASYFDLETFHRRQYIAECEKQCSQTNEELITFIGLEYARGLSITAAWSNIFSPHLFQGAMTRDK